MSHFRSQVIAHVRAAAEGGISFSPEQTVCQSLEDHLLAVAERCRKNASKFGCGSLGELIGLVHDIGKYSSAFQQYICSATGLLDQDCDHFVDAGKLRGKIDHSTAGAQILWRKCKDRGPKYEFFGQLMAICVASHHSGLIDCVGEDSATGDIANLFLNKRMAKPSNLSHIDEVIEKCSPEVMARIDQLIASPATVKEGSDVMKSIHRSIRKSWPEEEHIKGQRKNDYNQLEQVRQGIFLRILFSCLIDADRSDTRNFELPEIEKAEQSRYRPSWDILIERLERWYRNHPERTPIDGIRKQVADACLQRAADPVGLFSLTVPTGGGKTLASLRFALHHARANNLERIIYVIPFTSIIDQNAQVVREILESDENEFGDVVLEHHSNLTPDEETWRTKLFSESWDAPVIFTTAVQLLEALFGGGTRSVRRLHQLAGSVIIIDEVQTTPIRTVHLVNNALNLLAEEMSTSIVLCTATQPLLHRVDQSRGCLNLTSRGEIISDVTDLFRKLKRTRIVNKTLPEGVSIAEVGGLVESGIARGESTLAIVNTRPNARELFQELQKRGVDNLFHLSTFMCPAHRMVVLAEIRRLLARRVPIACVSTQLIEAGVDVDFDRVIRALAGMDSIAQAAGRCNRSGLRGTGETIVVNVREEKLGGLEEIKAAQEATRRVFGELREGADPLSPEVMERYFTYYFFDRRHEMTYPVKKGEMNLLELLSTNNQQGHIAQTDGKDYFRQAFSTAASHFRPIEDATQGIIVPYEERGKELVNELCSSWWPAHCRFLREAQRYSINLRERTFRDLKDKGAIFPIDTNGELEIYHLNPVFYSAQFGLNDQGSEAMEALYV